MKLNHTDNGNGQMAIIDVNLRCVAFVPKLHPDAELYIKLFENAPKLLEALKWTCAELGNINGNFEQLSSISEQLECVKELIQATE